MVNSIVSGASSIARKMASTTRGEMPGSSREPAMVKVLPEPVCNCTSGSRTQRKPAHVSTVCIAVDNKFAELP